MALCPERAEPGVAWPVEVVHSRAPRVGTWLSLSTQPTGRATTFVVHSEEQTCSPMSWRK